MTNTRTMTRSQAAALIAGQPTPCQQELLDALVDAGMFMDENDAIQMDVIEALRDAWPNTLHYPDKYGYENLAKAVISALADRLNLPPAVKGAPE